MKGKGVVRILGMLSCEGEYLITLQNKYGTFDFRVPEELLSYGPGEYCFFEGEERGVAFLWDDYYGVCVYLERMDFSFRELYCEGFLQVLVRLCPYVRGIEIVRSQWIHEWLKEKEELPF